MPNKKQKPYIVYKGIKYVRGFGLMRYKGKNKITADKYYKVNKSK